VSLQHEGIWSRLFQSVLKFKHQTMSVFILIEYTDFSDNVNLRYQGVNLVALGQTAHKSPTNCVVQELSALFTSS